jgi:hypothetical protein
MTDLRTAAQHALEALEFLSLEFFMLDPISPGRESTIKAITALRAALAEPVEEPVAWHYTNNGGGNVMHWGPSARLDADIQAANASRAGSYPEEDPELSAALGWVGGISEPVLDRKALLRRVAEIARDMQAKTKRAWDVGYDSGLKAASEFAAERRLNDAEIGEIWFNAKMPGVTETQARLLIRAAEAKLKDNHE